MSAQQLQKLMIINKTKQLGWWIRLKSVFVTLLTWGIWLVMGFMIWQHRNSLLDSPVIDIYYIGEVILFIFAVVFTLIFLTVCWSYLAKSRNKKP
ncbi:peptidylprolyl isomerase [Actinobacillus genomosp. 1]|uniref:peptidylprolyl isomerase n=1 Tax=Actinobacillus genomosp. 1 TaxID=254839 RepID=UPI0024416511|nr:peptidylprolyl isomerase [Actinobacillus genomosp. 1]WGE33869.1 peptidylprolyl isomerase [Actinobacillus genomosp. 1]WGE35915.1 peptidylprolyl isomerase [Actinobacillus genomosp. 1]WGE91250.1 peptidylprolyl isomerase [Actinobacillus genomosp. 1]